MKLQSKKRVAAGLVRLRERPHPDHHCQTLYQPAQAALLLCRVSAVSLSRPPSPS